VVDGGGTGLMRDEGKARIVAACDAPASSVSLVAHSHDFENQPAVLLAASASGAGDGDLRR